MNRALAKAQIEANIRNRFGPVFNVGEKIPAEYLPSGVDEIDRLVGGGLPRGAVTEMVGSASSGRMSLLLAALANTTSNSEIAAMIDTSDSFDPTSAVNAGVNFDRLLWVRCGKNLDRAFKATDLLLQSGGFGLVGLNLAEVTANIARRIISTWWFRFRRAIENTPTAFVVISPVACVRSCAAVILEMQKSNDLWPASSTTPTNQMNHLRIINGRRISLIDSSYGQHSFSFPNHTSLLSKINVQVKLAKPTIWSTASVQFRQIPAGPPLTVFDDIR